MKFVCLYFELLKVDFGSLACTDSIIVILYPLEINTVLAVCQGNGSDGVLRPPEGSKCISLHLEASSCNLSFF